MAIFLRALEGVLTILALIGTGWVLARRGWFDESGERLVPRLVTYVSLPALMLWNLTSNFDRPGLLRALHGLAVPFLSMILCLLIGLLAARLLRISPRRRGVFVTTFFCSNTIFIGIPVNLALFGEASLPFVLLYFFANTTLFWTLGNHLIGRDGTRAPGGSRSAAPIHNLLSPPFAGFLASVAVILLGVPLPRFVLDAAKYLGGMTTALSLIFVGVILSHVRAEELRPDREILAALVGRFLVSPLSVLLAAFLFPVPELTRQVFLIQASLPAMTQVTLVARLHGADAEYAARLTAITTLASAALIPLTRLLIA
jgi:hypothetical protein